MIPLQLCMVLIGRWSSLKCPEKIAKFKNLQLSGTEGTQSADVT